MFSEKLKTNAPYNVFFTEISDSPEINQMNSIRFTDLLCPSLGTLTSSLQLTFALNTNWLIASANLSRSAWRTIQKYTNVGVLFLPSFFNEPYYVIEQDENANGNLFPFIYDLPLTPYNSDGSPKCTEDFAVDSSTM